MVDHYIRYLYGTRHLAIEFLYNCSGAEFDTGTITARDLSNNIIFKNSADISFTNNPNRQSIEDYIFKLFRGIIDWVSRKQATVIISIIEAKLLAILYVGKEAI